MGESSSTISLGIVKTEVSFETDSVSSNTLNDYQSPVPSLGDIRKCDDVYMKKSSTNTYLQHKMNQETSYLAVSDMSDCPIKVVGPPENNYTLALEKVIKHETLCDLTNENSGIVDSKSTSPPNYSIIDIKTGNTTHATSSHEFLKNEDSIDITSLDLVKKETSKCTLMRGKGHTYSSTIQDNVKMENSSDVSEREKENMVDRLVCGGEESVTTSSRGTVWHQTTSTVEHGPEFSEEVKMEDGDNEDIRNDVVALLKEYGFQGRVTEEVIQQIVAMLKNDTLPTYDQMLAMLGLHPDSASDSKADESKDIFPCPEYSRRKNLKRGTSHEGEEPSHLTDTLNKCYKCTVCSKEFSHRRNMHRHMRIHTDEKSYKCTVCSKAFSQSGDMRKHMRIHTDEKSYKCTVCNKAFRLSSYMKDHMRIHSDEKPYKCTVCNRAFRLSSYMKRHMRTHSDEKPFKCTVCNKAFRLSSKMKYHMRIHSDEKPYKCTVCNKAFRLSSKMKDHMRIHSDEKPYKCTVCNKAFRSSSNMIDHMKIHRDEKPYKCTVCNKAFMLSSYMKYHMRIHSNEKPYKCTVCNKAFRSSSNMMDHMKIHKDEKPYKCTVCNTAFKSSSYMKHHMRIHCDEKPFKCTVCNTAFKSSSYRKHHMRIHSDEKPYKCTVCNKAFRQRCNMRKHMRIHSGEK